MGTNSAEGGYDQNSALLHAVNRRKEKIEQNGTWYDVDQEEILLSGDAKHRTLFPIKA